MKCNVVCDNCGTEIDNPYIRVLDMKMIEDPLENNNYINVVTNVKFTCPSCGHGTDCLSINRVHKSDLEPIVAREVEKEHIWKKTMCKFPFQKPIRGEK